MPALAAGIRVLLHRHSGMREAQTSGAQLRTGE
jgi:hypothetical protein